MIEFTNLDQDLTNGAFTSSSNGVIDGENAILIPAVTDPHVHFRTPGQTYKEDWIFASQASFKGGVTTVFDMPNNSPPILCKKTLLEKKKQIKAVLKDIPLQFGLYLGASVDHLDQIPLVKKDIIGIKVFLGSSTGSLLFDDEIMLEKLFQIASAHDLLLAIHAEEETRIRQRKSLYKTKDPSTHSCVRDPIAAKIAVEKACNLAIKYNTRLYFVHISTQQELLLIEQAKKHSSLIFAEACPHHLFFDDTDYARFGKKLLVNPPIRAREDRLFLIEALQKGIIDTIGSDHAPHLLKEKLEQDLCCGIAGTDAILPVLFSLYKKKALSLKRIVEITSKNQEKIFRLPKTCDAVLIDTRNKQPFLSSSKCAWSVYDTLVFPCMPCILFVKNKVIALSSEGTKRMRQYCAS